MILHPEAITLTRYAAGSYISGAWVNGAASVSTIYANEQPVTEHMLQRLPEGARQRGVKAWLTKTEIRTADQVASTAADRITGADGKVYEVDLVDQFRRGIVAHYEVLATRVQESG